MEKLAEDVTARLKEQAFCVVFEDDLERCWPREKLGEEEREQEIEVFANSRGWIAIILSVDSGIRAVFQGCSIFWRFRIFNCIYAGASKARSEMGLFAWRPPFPEALRGKETVNCPGVLIRTTPAKIA